MRHWGKILVEYKGQLISNPPLVLCAPKGKNQFVFVRCFIQENHLYGLLVLQRKNKDLRNRDEDSIEEDIEKHLEDTKLRVIGCGVISCVIWVNQRGR